MFQELVLIPTFTGVTKSQAQEILNQAQALRGNYLEIMRKQQIYGDVSFLIEIAGQVWLASYYNSQNKLNHQTDIDLTQVSDPLMRSYLSAAIMIFDISKRKNASPANSFWIKTEIKERLG